MPLILTVYEAQTDMAYWEYIQARLALIGPRASWQEQKTTTARIPRANVLDASAVRRFAHFRGLVYKDRGTARHRYG